MKQQRPSTVKEKILRWKYSSRVHENLLPSMFHRILVFKFESTSKNIQMKKFQDENTQVKFMKIYFHQQCYIEFWFSSSNQLQKTFKIRQCNVHSLLAKFYLTRTPVNYERKFSKKMTKSTSWKIYICQQRRNLWFSRSGKLHEKSKITQCNKTRKRSKCFTHHIDPMLV